jgi:hypothetical protein
MTKISNQYSLTNVLTADVVNGRVGVGTTSPDSKLNVVGGRSTFYANSESFAINVKYNSAAERGYWIGSPASGIMSFSNADGTERLRITDAGNVGIGTSSPASLLQVSGATGTNVTPQLTLTNTTTNGYGVLRLVGASRGGFIDFYENSAAQASIVGQGGAFYVYTNGDSSGSPKLTITSAGNVEINGGHLNMSGSGEINHTGRILMDAGANNGFLLRTDNGGVNAMTIASAGTITFSSLGSGAVTATSGVLSTTSDMTLKVDDGYIDNALEKISKLTPRYFYWKEESGLPTDIRQLGFYAQEVNQALGEEAANTPKNENDKWGIYDRGIIAMLTKAIQELSADLTSAKQEIELLKAK